MHGAQAGSMQIILFVLRQIIGHFWIWYNHCYLAIDPGCDLKLPPRTEIFLLHPRDSDLGMLKCHKTTTHSFIHSLKLPGVRSSCAESWKLCLPRTVLDRWNWKSFGRNSSSRRSWFSRRLIRGTSWNKVSTFCNKTKTNWKLFGDKWTTTFTNWRG